MRTRSRQIAGLTAAVVAVGLALVFGSQANAATCPSSATSSQICQVQVIYLPDFSGDGNPNRVQFLVMTSRNINKVAVVMKNGTKTVVSASSTTPVSHGSSSTERHWTLTVNGTLTNGTAYAVTTTATPATGKAVTNSTTYTAATGGGGGSCPKTSTSHVICTGSLGYFNKNTPPQVRVFSTTSRDMTSISAKVISQATGNTVCTGTSSVFSGPAVGARRFWSGRFNCTLTIGGTYTVTLSGTAGKTKATPLSFTTQV